ncbi:MAG: hypothetical protein GY939_06865 [Actinomycetia bacterium]|nr:hypothetical protein [Actinomycetes bacterium]
MSDQQQWNDEADEQPDDGEPTSPPVPGSSPHAPTQVANQGHPPQNQPQVPQGPPQYQPPTQAHYQPPTQPVQPTQQAPPIQPEYQQQQPGQPQYYEQPGQGQAHYQQQPGQQYYGQPGQIGYVDQATTGGGLGDVLRRNGGRFGIVAAVVLIGAAGTFALWRALSGPGGADTPEEAAAMFFAALDEEDVLAVAEIALPSEREAVLEPSTAVLVELARLDLLADDAIDDDGNPLGLFGIQFDIPADGEPGALVYAVEPVGGRDDIQWVTVTDGMIEVTYDPKVVQDSFEGRLREWIETENANSDLSVQTETVDLGQEFQNDTPLEFAVVEEGGAFYVSWTYTVAGFANDKVAPPFDQAPTPVGADSPEQAAIDFIDNLMDLDATGTMTMLDPQEFRAVYDYWGVFGPDLARTWDEARTSVAGGGLTWGLVSAEASAEDRNGRKIVSYDEIVLSVTSSDPGLPTDLTFTVNGDGLLMAGTVQGNPAELSVSGQTVSGSATIDGESFAGSFNLETFEGWYEVGGTHVTITRDGDCLILAAGADQQRFCDEDLSIDGASDGLFNAQENYQTAFADAGRPGLTVVERDGRWYVSGFPTFAYTAVDFLHALDLEEVEQLIENYQELVRTGLGTQLN